MTIKTLLAHKYFWFVLAFSWSAIILFLCLVNNDDLPTISIKVSGVDKIVHFTFHFIFTVLWANYFFKIKRNLLKPQILKVILSSFIFGVFIEILQGSFTITRKADILDVIANTLGAVSAGIVLYFIFNRINKLKT